MVTSENTSKKQRIEWIDTAKGFCIMLVVFNHTFLFLDLKDHIPPILYDYLNSFRMPLYFFLSGVFFKTYGSLSNFTRKKINKLIIPFLFFYTVFSILIPYITIKAGYNYPYVNSENSLYSFCFDFYNNDCQLVNGPLWFLLCLFEINIIFYVINSVFKKESNIYLLSIICGAIGITLSVLSINIPISIDTSFTCLPFFCFGYYIRNHTTIISNKNIDNRLILYSMACGIILIFFTRHVEFHTNELSNSSLFTVHIAGITGTMMVIFLSKRIGKIYLISYLGRFSIIILCTHLLLIELYLPLLNRFLPQIPCLFILFIIIIISELVIIPLFVKYLPYVTAQKDLLP